jgi:integrator complex subunit 7
MDKFSDFSLDLSQNEAIDEQNVNAIWVELDKGLFSDNIGSQCEAIVKFTDLFDRFPLPVFVNNGFLKLAKIFQNGSNYLKLHVIRVIEKNEKHLDKILSGNELTKLIFYNIHSNDSLSRALTLHALAAFSPIIAEKQNVHHSIRNALESHDDIEAKEAIYAAIKFTSISKSFADSVCDHISIMLEDITTPLDRKIKLLPILVNMHHDTQISLKANRVCRWMYDSFPRTDIRTIVLNILTKISSKSLTNINETLTFFIQLLHEELRGKLSVVLLNNLHNMAQNASHLWTQNNIKSFLSYLKNSSNEDKVSKCLKILSVLAGNSNTGMYLEFCNGRFYIFHSTLA